MEETIKKLEEKIIELENKLNSFYDTSELPLELENALSARLAGLRTEGNSVGTFVQSGLERSINLSGNAETIKVLEYPTNYILVKFAGNNYKIPILND